MTNEQVANAAETLVLSARTPMNARGFVSSDEVRAFLVRTTKTRVDGAAVTFALSSLFVRREDNRFVVHI